MRFFSPGGGRGWPQKRGLRTERLVGDYADMGWLVVCLFVLFLQFLVFGFFGTF